MPDTMHRTQVLLEIGQDDNSDGTLEPPATDVFDPVGQLDVASDPLGIKETLPVTHLQSKKQESIAALPTEGELNCEGFRDKTTPDAGQDRCLADMSTNVLRNFRLVIQNPLDDTELEKHEFVGEIMEFSYPIGTNEPWRFNLRVRVDSLVTIT